MFRVLTLFGAISLTSALRLQLANSSQYDYVIVGGGTSGLVIANRLSEDPAVSVVVIEAGGSVYDNPNVTAMDGYGLAFGTPVDYQYESVPQIHGGNSKQVLRAGKALGGTSTINGMAYTRAEDVQIDAWKMLGNEGWTWDDLLPYYLKSESLTRPNVSEKAAGASFHALYHGYDGPLRTGFTGIEASNLTATFNKTYEALGVPWSEDVNGGRMRGVNIYPETIDYFHSIREDAARAYYWPYKDRPNLTVMMNTVVNNIIWKGNSTVENITASGVSIASHNGTTSVITAKKEVILSAGSLRSPAILELSGVGNPAILRKHNITVRVNLPTVGENMQDQMNAEMSAVGRSNFTGVKTVAYLSVSDIFGDETSTVADSVLWDLAGYAAATANVSGGVMSENNLMRLFEIQYNLIFGDQVPVAEILLIPTGSKALVTEFWALLPFARGNVHIASANPADRPIINPNYFMLEWDTQQHVAVAKYIRRLYDTAPLKDLIQNETAPGFAALPKDASDEIWADYAKHHYRSNFHPVGTAAMMPRQIGGVVNSRLAVYGTTNVRVVDASVLPFQLSGHLSSTLYAVAERAADLIKEDARRLP